MAELSLSEAQDRREELLLNQELDRKIGLMLSSKDVTPKERYQLRNLLKYYAKKPKPFTACVRDNTKRFGPDGAKRVCATLKDIIRGTTKWRKGGKSDKGTAGLKGLSEDYEPVPEINTRLAEILDSITEQELGELIYD